MVVNRIDQVQEKQAEMQAKMDELLFYKTGSKADKEAAAKAATTVKKLWPFTEDFDIQIVINHKPSLDALRQQLLDVLPRLPNKHGSFLRAVSSFFPPYNNPIQG